MCLWAAPMSPESEHHAEGERRQGERDGPPPGQPNITSVYWLHIYENDPDTPSTDPYCGNYLALTVNSECEALIHPAYQQFMCPVCHLLDKDALFEHGFEEGPIVCVNKGLEITRTPDGFICITTRVMDLLKSQHVAGYETKPIPFTDWHVLRITKKIPCAQERPDFFTCRHCGASFGFRSWYTAEDLTVPVGDNTFLTTELEYRCGCELGMWHRTQRVYMTENVGRILEAAHVFAGFLERLMSHDEIQSLEEVLAGRAPRPRNMTIRLYGRNTPQ